MPSALQRRNGTRGSNAEDPYGATFLFWGSPCLVFKGTPKGKPKIHFGGPNLEDEPFIPISFGQVWNLSGLAKRKIGVH